MNKLKDIFYDKNDILVALIILAIASLVIVTRIDAIMAYPEHMAKQLLLNSEEDSALITPKPDELTASNKGENGENSGIASNAAINGNQETGTSSNGAVEMYAVYINYGETIEQIGEKFVLTGIFSSTDEFVQLVNEKSVATKIKSGNFIIPSNSTKDEVIEYICKPGL